MFTNRVMNSLLELVEIAVTAKRKRNLRFSPHCLCSILLSKSASSQEEEEVYRRDVEKSFYKI